MSHQAQTISDFENVERWIQRAQDALAADPGNLIHNLTRVSAHGDATGWTSAVNRTFTAPVTYEEVSQQMVIHDILREAMERRLRIAELRSRDGTARQCTAWDLGDVYCVANVVMRASAFRGRPDIPMAALVKMRMNRAAKNVGTTLQALIANRFMGLLILSENCSW